MSGFRERAKNHLAVRNDISRIFAKASPKSKNPRSAKSPEIILCLQISGLARGDDLTFDENHVRLMHHETCLLRGDIVLLARFFPC